MTTGFSAQMLRVAYMTMQDFAASTGRTWRQGDIIKDADVVADNGPVNWQELALNNDITAFKFITEPLSEDQYGNKVRGQISQKGFEKPEGVITRPLDAVFSVTHKSLLTNGLGAEVPGGGEVSTVDSDVVNSATVTTTTDISAVAGFFVRIGDNISLVLSAIGPILTLANKITAKAGDAVVELIHYDPDTLGDDAFLMFVETAKGNHLISWVRFGIDFGTAPNELLKLMINWQGDMAQKSNLTWVTIAPGGGTVTEEENSKAMETSNFVGISLADSDNVCLNSFDFKLTREMTRINSQGTESQQGNGGTFRDNYDAEITAIAYADELNSIYEANDYLYVLAQKKSFAIYAPGALIRTEDTNTVNDKMHETTYVIGANVDMTKSMMITFGEVV